MLRAVLHTDQTKIWWVYLLEGMAAIAFGLLLPKGFLLLSSPVAVSAVPFALSVLLVIQGLAFISWAFYVRNSDLAIQADRRLSPTSSSAFCRPRLGLQRAPHAITSQFVRSWHKADATTAAP